MRLVNHFRAFFRNSPKRHSANNIGNIIAWETSFCAYRCKNRVSNSELRVTADYTCKNLVVVARIGNVDVNIVFCKKALRLSQIDRKIDQIG